MSACKEERVRRELVEACAAAGGLREFCRLHGLDPGNVSNVINKRRPMQSGIAAAIGYEPVTMYRRLQG